MYSYMSTVDHQQKCFKTAITGGICTTIINKVCLFCEYSCKDINGSKLDQTTDTVSHFLRAKVNISLQQ